MRIARNQLEGLLDRYKGLEEDHPFIMGLVDTFTPIGTIAAAGDLIVNPSWGKVGVALLSVNPATRLGSRALRAAVKACTCFEAGTLVATADGLRPIEELEVGDLVLARDDLTGVTALKPVLAVFVNKDVIWDVTLEITEQDGSVTMETIRTTSEHPFRTVDNRWIEVEGLVSGTRIRTADGRMAVVISRINTNRLTQTYNSEVADFHTFFVGKAGVWVHNSCPIRGPRFFRGKARDEVVAKGRQANGKFKCAYCDNEATQADHIVPYSRGGPTVPSNGNPACPACNLSKGSRSLDDFLNGR